MKCAVIMANGIKQIMLSPENKEEKMALQLITPNDDIKLDLIWGTMFDRVPPSAAKYVVQKSRGDYLRAYEQEEALMLVLTPKEEPPKEANA
jgi:hypothetical protein